MSKHIVAIDPGESIGICFTQDNEVYGLTIKEDTRLLSLYEWLTQYVPQVVVYETFALRQSAAAHLVGNKFITCQVIGVIELYCLQHPEVKVVRLQPANKEYCGFSASPDDPQFRNIKMANEQKITEHTRDAYRLYRYAKLFRKELYD